MSCGQVAEGVEGENPAETTMPKRRTMKRVDKGTCQRCRSSKSMFIIRNTTTCAPCFEANVYARLTRQLYPALHSGEIAKSPAKRNLYRPTRLQSHAMIALSGGAGSMAMLEMLLRGVFVGTGQEDKVADKRKGEKEVIWPRGYIVYVEFAGVIEGGEDRTEFMRDIAVQRNLEFVGLRAEDVFDPELRSRLGGRSTPQGEFVVDLKDATLSISSIASSSSTPLEKLRTLVASLPPPSRPALLSNILRALLTIAASTIPNISHLLIGETATRQAQRVISGTASGRGWALPLELAGRVDLPDGLIRLSPMKEISLKEAAFACKLRGINTLNHRNWSKAGGEGKRDARGKGGAMSIEGLTEQFIAGLSVTHPATVSTINRTGDKLQFPGGDSRDDLCPLCQMPVDPSALEWKSRTALTSLSKTPAESYDQDEGGDVEAINLARDLCYACLTTLTPLSHGKNQQAQSVPLPLWVGHRIQVDRQGMKAQIGQYLLEEEV